MAIFRADLVQVDRAAFNRVIEAWCVGRRMSLRQLSQRCGKRPTWLYTLRRKLRDPAYRAHIRTLDVLSRATDIPVDALAGQAGGGT